MIARRPAKIFLALIGLLALFVVGLSLRRMVLQSQYALYQQELPFNLESALEFRYVGMLFAGQPLPVIDRQIQAPEGIVVRETYTIGAEYFYALAAKLFPAKMNLSERVRWIAAGWFCLGIPLLSLWLWIWLKSGWAAAVGGMYYAVALPAIMRSTGQELSHENFALPILIGHLALNALAAKRPQNPIWAILAAALLGWALTAWDLIQYYIAIWVVLHYGRVVGPSYFKLAWRRQQWGIILIVLTAVGLMNPYLKAHGFLASPTMLLAYGIGLGILMQQAWPKWNGLACRMTIALAALLPLVLGYWLLQTYPAAYSHFGELLLAKLRFLNQKPADPALLTFAQRILWSPALHSANWPLTITLFPATLPLFGLILIIIGCQARWRSNPEIIQLLWFSGLSLLTYFLFVRFHVFLIIALAALLGWTASWATERKCNEPTHGRRSITTIILRSTVLLFLLVGIGVEAGNVLRAPTCWGSEPKYLIQKQELVQWLRANDIKGPVLANFGISAYMLAYADCSIILHPKFESPEIRSRVQAYGEALFKSNESNFRDWADQHAASWYVYALGEFAAAHPDLQMRYCVNALQPPTTAAARLFEYQPDDLRYFQWLWGNSKYRVYRIIRRTDELQAERQAGMAEEALARGQLQVAEMQATLALLYDPHAKRAQQVLLHIGSLQEQGIH